MPISHCKSHCNLAFKAFLRTDFPANSWPVRLSLMTYTGPHIPLPSLCLRVYFFHMSILLDGVKKDCSKETNKKRCEYTQRQKSFRYINYGVPSGKNSEPLREYVYPDLVLVYPCSHSLPLREVALSATGNFSVRCKLLKMTI